MVGMTEPAPASAPQPPNTKIHLVSALGEETAPRIPLPTLSEGAWRVTGPAGSGLTALIVETVLARLAAGEDPRSIQVLTATKESATRIRKAIARRLPELGGTDAAGASAAQRFAAEGPLVRSIHSFAFAIVRSAALRAGDPSPRLLTGAEHDLFIRELLRGTAERHPERWPDDLRPALTMVSFAREARDFLLRAAERGLGPGDLRQLGEQYHRPRWVSAAALLQEYREVAALAWNNAYTAAELVSAALGELGRNPDLLATYREQFRTVLVDDAQHLDPISGSLVQLFTDSAKLAVVAGRPQHSIFRFRGASPDFFQRFPHEHELELPDQGRRQATTQARIVGSPSEQADLIAETLRKQHLLGGVPWDQMAVVVRNTGDLPAMRRTLLAGGVPVVENASEVVLSEQRLVQAMMLGIKAITSKLDRAELERLLTGPIGGADPVTLRRLLRGLRQAELRRGGTRRAIDVLADIIAEDSAADLEEDVLTPREIDILGSVSSVLRAGRKALADGSSVELVLWSLWEATGLAEHLSAVALRGGPVGSQADRDLDAMMALFDAAGDFVERRGDVGIEAFARHIDEQELPTGTRDRRGVGPDAVSLVTAHATTGREWRVVIVAGVQEGEWPSFGATGTLMGQEELIDLVDDGIEPGTDIARAAVKLAEERRLFQVATSRATDFQMVTALNMTSDANTFEPSRFVEELGPVEGEVPRVPAVPHLVAELRRAVADESADARLREVAAYELGRLAEAGVADADPDSWWGSREPSTDNPLEEPGQPAHISPSRVEAILACPLRATLSPLVEDTAGNFPMFRGTVVHAYAEAVANGASRVAAKGIACDAMERVLVGPDWARDLEMTQFRELLDLLDSWIDERPSQGRKLLGVEVDVNVRVTETRDGEPLNVTGRIDRLEQNSSDELEIVDFKTGRAPISAKEAKENQQLACYQLAVSEGRWTGQAVRSRSGAEGSVCGGASLIYPAKASRGKASERHQDPKDADSLAALTALLPEVVEDRRGPQLAAKANEGCSRCVLKVICPIQPEGSALTDV